MERFIPFFPLQKLRVFSTEVIPRPPPAGGHTPEKDGGQCLLLRPVYNRLPPSIIHAIVEIKRDAGKSDVASVIDADFPFVHHFMPCCERIIHRFTFRCKLLAVITRGVEIVGGQGNQG